MDSVFRDSILILTLDVVGSFFISYMTNQFSSSIFFENPTVLCDSIYGYKRSYTQYLAWMYLSVGYYIVDDRLVLL